MSKRAKQDGLSVDAVGAGLDELWDRETKGSDTASEQETAEPDPVLERIFHRPQIKDLYEWAIRVRDNNAPRQVSGWLSGPGVQHTAHQRPELYAQGLLYVRLIDEFSELAEKLIDEDILNPERAIARTLEDVVRKRSRAATKLLPLQHELTALCEISKLYRKDAT
ncbi:MAG TPA: hypothetical protein VIF43_00780 [Patescibacteria group bacterium]|jgi:hypothetical protein